MTTTIDTARDLNGWETQHLARFRSTCSGDAEALAELAETETIWRARPQPGLCPPWCSAAPGHGWTDEDPHGDVGRYHHATFGDGVFYVSQFEQANPDGTTTILAPETQLDWDVHPRNPITDPMQVVNIAHGALDAAHLVREILSRGNWPVTA